MTEPRVRAGLPSVSIVIITYLRPESVEVCLEHLSRQSDPADQTVVVDASPARESAAVVAGFPWATYLPNPAGAGNMTNSRNAALHIATGDVIAFLDDDAYAEPGYVRELRAVYADPTVALACSRTLNDRPGEEQAGIGEVGRFLPDGSMTAHFAADPGRIVDIDHGIGATMSFRRDTLASLGGFREDYRGTSGIREDTDVFLRAGELGYRAVFINAAVARHVGAPQAHGRRFDFRYEHWAGRNTVILFVNNFGMRWEMLRRLFVGGVVYAVRDETRTVPRRLVRVGAIVGGWSRGLAFVLLRQRGRRLPPARSGADATDIRVALARELRLGQRS